MGSRADPEVAALQAFVRVQLPGGNGGVIRPPSMIATGPRWRLGALLSGRILSDSKSDMTTRAQVKLMRRSNSFDLLPSRFDEHAMPGSFRLYWPEAASRPSA